MRLGYGVREFAEEGGVSMETQRAFESDKALPYTPEIRKMIDDFKDAEPSIQDAAKDMLKKSAEKKRGSIADSKKKT
jgi:hypothetical protein